MRTERRLTSFSHGAGCGCKLGPSDLAQVLAGLSIPDVTDEVLVGGETGDDAAVVRLPDGHALIATLDFFTPIVDEPYDWGRIAATNALSDVYAMGGTPFLALNIVAWPVDDLPLEMLGQVLQGGIDVASKAGAAVLGGHTITDPEPKYGMVALGLADPQRIVRNSTAVKRGVADEALLARAVDVMTTLNDEASSAMREVRADAATDVTGFGLLGHLHRMLLASGVSATIDANAIPVLDGVLDLAERDVVPGGTKRNHAYVAPHVGWGDLTPPEQHVLADAQTSGGLLIAATDGDALAGELERRAVPHAEIGAVASGPPGSITVSGRLDRP
jgi:selenide, water dikinase